MYRRRNDRYHSGKPLVTLGTLALLAVLFAGPAAALKLSFENNSGYPDNQVYVAFQGTVGDTISYSNNLVAFSTNYLTKGVDLGTLASNGGYFDLSTLHGGFFVSFGDSLPQQAAAPAFLGAAASTTPFQTIELTANGNANDGGDTTAINVFSAPMGITSYDFNGNVLQSKQWNTNTATIVSSIQSYANNSNFYVTAVTPAPTPANPSATVTNIVRYLGPSTFPPPPGLPALPYPSWQPYLTKIGKDLQVTTLTNSSGFNIFNGVWVPAANPGNPSAVPPVAPSTNYGFAFNLLTTVTTNGVGAPTAIVMAGSVGTTINPYGQGVTAGPLFTNFNVTIPVNTTSAVAMKTLNFDLYGAILPTNAVFSGSGYTNWVAYINSIPGLNDPVNGPLNKIPAQMSGEFSAGLTTGFINSTNIPPGGAVAYKDMPSDSWWNTTAGYSSVQANPSYYNQWAATVSDYSSNQVYGSPYSDRFTSESFNPGIASYSYTAPLTTQVTPIESWVINIGTAVPKISAYAPYIIDAQQKTKALYQAGRFQDAYATFAYKNYYLYLQEEQLTGKGAGLYFLNQYYQNLALAYYLSYYNAGYPSVAVSWYNYIHSFEK